MIIPIEEAIITMIVMWLSISEEIVAGGDLLRDFRRVSRYQSHLHT